MSYLIVLFLCFAIVITWYYIKPRTRGEAILKVTVATVDDIHYEVTFTDVTQSLLPVEYVHLVVHLAAVMLKSFHIPFSVTTMPNIYQLAAYLKLLDHIERVAQVTTEQLPDLATACQESFVLADIDLEVVVMDMTLFRRGPWRQVAGQFHGSAKENPEGLWLIVAQAVFHKLEGELATKLQNALKHMAEMYRDQYVSEAPDAPVHIPLIALARVGLLEEIDGLQIYKEGLATILDQLRNAGEKVRFQASNRMRI